MCCTLSCVQYSLEYERVQIQTEVLPILLVVFSFFAFCFTLRFLYCLYILLYFVYHFQSLSFVNNVLSAVLKVPSRDVCGYDPCNGESCQDNPNARCLVTTKCRPVFVNSFNERIRKCEGKDVTNKVSIH